MMLQSCHCCCCCKMPLAKASRIIGITWAILAIVSMIRGCVSLMTGSDYRNVFDSSDGIAEEAHTTLLMHVCSSVLWAITGTVLAIGVSRQSPCLVVVFLAASCLGLTLSTMVTLYAFYDPSGFIGERELAQLEEQHELDSARIVVYAVLCFTLAIIAFFWYLWMVVFSYYKQLTSDLQQEQLEFRQVPISEQQQKEQYRQSNMI